MSVDEKLLAAAEELIEFNGDWHYYYTPGQNIGNPVHVPWDLYRKTVAMALHIKATLGAENQADADTTNPERTDR